MSDYTQKLVARVKTQNQNEPEFHQAVEEVVESLDLVLKDTRNTGHQKSWKEW